jgi:hypothetical protein
MKHYPILFRHGGLLAGRDFIAHYDIRGRCVLEEYEEGDFCVMGVNPGGLASSYAPGGTEALRDFVRNVRLVVLDLASEASNFAAFERTVLEFVQQTCTETEKEWRAARALVRQGDLNLPGLKREESDDVEPRVSVRLVATPNAGMVPFDSTLNEPAGAQEELLLAAA